MAVLDSGKSIWAEKIFLVKKWVYGGPRLWQLKYRCQSTAAAMEANPGGFGGLFGCSWRWKIQLGRKKIFRIKKWAAILLTPQPLPTQGVSPRFFLKSANRNAATQPPSTTKYSQAFIGVPGGALDLGGTRTIGTSAMADDGVSRFAEIPRWPGGLEAQLLAQAHLTGCDNCEQTWV